jgi:hypothetical protein
MDTEDLWIPPTLKHGLPMKLSINRLDGYIYMKPDQEFGE